MTSSNLSYEERRDRKRSIPAFLLHGLLRTGTRQGVRGNGIQTSPPV